MEFKMDALNKPAGWEGTAVRLIAWSPGPCYLVQDEGGRRFMVAESKLDYPPEGTRYLDVDTDSYHVFKDGQWVTEEA